MVLLNKHKYYFDTWIPYTAINKVINKDKKACLRAPGDARPSPFRKGRVALERGNNLIKAFSLSGDFLICSG